MKDIRGEDMKFQDYVYTRPEMDKLEASFAEQITKIQEAKSAKEQIDAVNKINVLRKDFETMAVLCSIRNSIDTKDAFYEQEQNFFDEVSPVYSGLENQLAKAIYFSEFKDELIEEYGSHLFNLIETKLKTFDPAIIEDLQLENKLSTEYQRLSASAQIEFDGKILNLSQMTPYAQSKDRDVRRRAEAAVAGFFTENEEKFDEIYDKLVKTRVKIAEKLGFESFIALAYARLNRTDYDADMVANYRKQVYEDVVPFVSDLMKDKAQRLGIKEEDLKSYDLNLQFLSGNATPKKDRAGLVNVAKKMYHEMSKETDVFFQYMTNNELLDLDAKPGKAGGGYCTFIANYKSPFIFANFNGTSGDVDVLTHEAGHAFQIFSCREFDIMEYLWPTLEACEIHSMSMEFFAWPWMDGFFEEDTDKYLYSHLAGAVSFLPYGVAVDEFQHLVFENPNLTPAERKAAWREIEKKYLPFKVYENDFLNRGGFFYRQGHIFGVPFYYIDYTLAQVCAFQYWARDRANHEEAWNSYVKLCQEGGSKSFLGLIEVAGLNNPFESGTVKEAIAPIKKFLAEFDQSKLQ